MIKRILSVFISIGIIIAIMNGCDKDKDNPVNSVNLLTNDSSKIWRLSKIVIADLITIIPLSCIVDDEHQFQLNGSCLIDNKGTIYNNAIPPLFSEPPQFCKDTIDIVDTAFWTLSAKMDSLTVSTHKYVLTGKILKLTSDSLIIKRTYKDLSVQTEYYSAKK